MTADAPALLCDLCPEPAIAVAPGTEPVRELFVLDAGEPRRQFCLQHWPCRPRAEVAA